VYVGGKGTDADPSLTANTLLSGGFNGGEDGYTVYYTANKTYYYASAGGGASDIRIGNDSLYARVIVAGGGGGSGEYGTSNFYSGGSGGGTSGLAGEQYSTSYLAGLGGSQVAGGTSYRRVTADNTDYGSLSAFGIGASAVSEEERGISGGCAGWYGGGYGVRSSGGGGTGWVYTADTFATWQEGNATDAANWLLNENYYLTDIATIAGDQSFTDFDGTTVTGHSGDGAVKITKLS